MLTPARELVDYLVQAGANLRIQDKEGSYIRTGGFRRILHHPRVGNTPLHIAVCSQAAEAEALVTILLRGQLELSLQNLAGATPMELASSEPVCIWSSLSLSRSPHHNPHQIRALLRDYKSPVLSAPKPALKKTSTPAPKRKGSENEIIVDGEGGDEEEEGGSISHPFLRLFAP